MKCQGCGLTHAMYVLHDYDGNELNVCKDCKWQELTVAADQYMEGEDHEDNTDGE